MDYQTYLRYFADFEHIYNMNHRRRGTMLLINNENFKIPPGPDGSTYDRRQGTELDAMKLQNVFTDLGFNVVGRNDLTITQMCDAVLEVADQDHSNDDCFALFILSHGDDNSLICGTDGVISLEKIIEPLKGNGCPSLVGKPKLIFVQACRGVELDDGVELNFRIPEGCDGTNQDIIKSVKIPTEADFFYAYATPPGHFAFRNLTNGSWFVQAIAKVFSELGYCLEINQLMTRVNRELAYGFESKSIKFPERSKKKQVSSFVSMLTKSLFFTRKEPVNSNN